MIDNSIIVLDNIDQYGGNGNPRLTAIAANEVIRPLISSALTTVAVFLPLVLLNGVAGALFRDQAVAVTLALVASLMVAYFLLPLLSIKLIRQTEVRTISITTSGRAWRLFDRTVTNFIRRPVLASVGVLLCIGLGGWLVSQLPTAGFPELSRSDYVLEVDWNSPLSLEEHHSRVLALTKSWRNRFGGETAALVGEQNFLLAREMQATTASTIEFYLPFPHSDPEFANYLLDSWRSRYPRAAFSFRPLPNLFDQIFLNGDPFLEVRLRQATGRVTPKWEVESPSSTVLRRKGFYLSYRARMSPITVRLNYKQMQVNRVDGDRLAPSADAVWGERSDPAAGQRPRAASPVS